MNYDLRESSVCEVESTAAPELAYARRWRSLASRTLAAGLACLLWTQSISFTHQAAQQDAEVLAGGMVVRASDWHLNWGVAPAAAAGPITDPYAPVQFQPQVTQSTGANGGVPVVNITAPNAAGISLNQYSQFNVDAAGLILNNSFATGVSLTGGTVAGNPNLAGRAASTIVNQVTSTGAQYASVINGPIEVFGTPANVVIANPNGITATGVGFTNTPNITLTTGVPQFLTGLGGTATDFTGGTALAYNVTSGHLQIEGPPGSAGPGAGLSGTVGEVDLIAQTVGINAPLYGGPRINVIAGNQLVSPQSSDTTGTTFSVAANSATNTAAAINAPNQLAIDATNFGAVTAGQIAIVATPAGLGVKADGALAATANNLTISANGDVSVNGTSAAQTSSVASTGNVALASSNLANQFTVSANGNITGSGDVSSATTVSMTAGGSLSAGAVQASGNVGLVAQQGSLTTGAIASGDSLLIGANGDVTAASTSAQQIASVISNGNVTLSGINVASQYEVFAGGNISVPDAIGSATDLTLTAGGGQTLGAVQATGDANLTAQGGSLTTTAVGVGGSLTMAAAGGLNTGTVQTAGNAELLALGGDITTAGVSVGGNLVAAAHGTLDTSAGQLNAAYSASAPALVVTGTASLTGANITTANATITGAYTATATGTLTTGGTAIYSSGATLNAGALTNVGQQIATGNLAVNAGTVTNQSGAQLASLQNTTVNSTDVTNAGTIYGINLNIVNAGGITNSGSLLANTTLNLATAQLDNTNGTIFAGNPSQPTAPVGDVTVGVSGGNGSFTNTNGQVLGQNSLTLNLPNQVFNPGAPSAGIFNGGGALNLAVQSIDNTGTWAVPGTLISVSATNGISNTGTIEQSAGALALNGAVSNSGTIVGPDIGITGSLNNAAGASIQVNDSFSLNGSGTNAGIIQAVNNINLSGTSFDNSNGVTQVGNASTAAGGGNLTVNLSGDLTNVGGTLSATNDASLTANNINNSVPGTTEVTTTTTVTNLALLLTTQIGTGTVSAEEALSHGGFIDNSSTIAVTLADLLSPTGNAQPVSLYSGPNIANYSVPTSTPYDSTGYANFVLQTMSLTNDAGDPVPVTNWVIDATGPGESVDAAAQQASSLPANQVVSIALPTTTETTVTVAPSQQASVISVGNDLTLTANALNNNAGTISAGHNATLNIQSLDNGGSNAVASVTDTIEQNSLNAFLTSLQQMVGIATSSPSTTPISTGFTTTNLGNVTYSGPVFAIAAPGSVTAPSTSSSIAVQGPVGQILAGNNLALQGGNLTNAGTLASGQDLTINATSFTNQGVNVGATTTIPGCVGGGLSAGCFYGGLSSASSQTFAYEQINSTVSAGRDIVIAANTVNNTFGTIAAGRDVVIGGNGTVVSNANPNSVVASLNTAANVVNTSGTISAGQDVLIQATNVINATAAAAQVHEDYGSTEAYSGCGGPDNLAFCEAYVDVQSANTAIITAAGNISIQTGTFSNDGGLISALNNVNIDATSSAENSDETLNAYWHSTFQDYGYTKTSYGCADATICQSLYGSSYGSIDQLDPPAPVGFISGTIQAGNNLQITSPTLTTSGNVYGTAITLTGSQLVNGLTSTNVYTPDSMNSQQVMSLAPSTSSAGRIDSVTSGGATTNIGVDTVNSPTAPVLASQSSATGGSSTYLVNSAASQVINEIGGTTLLQNLPANLQPANVPFYYDPYDEGNLIQQAALQATGKTSFDSGVSSTGQSTASVANQDKAYLYGNTIAFAEQNNIALGTQLSAAQLQLVNAPMLWYVQQTVPEPGCIATGNAACPTVQTLMPEVLLPPNYSSVSAGGQITGQNVTLDYQGGTVTNTGAISAEDLTVNAVTLTNQQRSTNIGGIYSEDQSTITTGTVVQPGGFMSAVNYDLNVSTLNQIGGALQQLNPDGTVNTAATQQLLGSLQAQLGSNFTQGTVQDDLHTALVDPDTGFGPMQLFAIVAAVIAAIALQPEISAEIATASGATDAGTEAAFLAASQGATGAAITTAGTVGAGTLGVGGLANIALSVGLSSLASSAVSQLISTGSINLTSAFESALVSGITAGLLSGITYTSGATGSGLGFSTTASADSLASLSGVQLIGSSVVPQAGTAVANNIPEELAALAANATISASVQTAIEGGSFLTNLQDAAVSDAAASGADAIGNAFDEQSGFWTTSNPLYVAEHAALGCVAGAAGGTGCAGGAIGGAVSAATANTIATAVTGGQGVTDQGQLAAITAATMLLSGGAAALLGANPIGAATAAENETLNNTCAQGHNCGTLASALTDTGRAAWNTALGVVQSVPNLVNGALPGYPDYVPFLSGSMLPYDDPDFGGLVSLLGTVGAASLVGSSSGGSITAADAAITNAGYTYDAMNPGPLPDSVAGTFAGGRYSVGTIDSFDQVLFKAGDASNPGGSFFSFDMPQSVAQTRIDSAVKPYWIDPSTGAKTGASPINSVITAQFPAGTAFYYGPVGTQGGVYLGGQSSIQIFIPSARSIGTFTPIAPLK